MIDVIDKMQDIASRTTERKRKHTNGDEGAVPASAVEQTANMVIGALESFGVEVSPRAERLTDKGVDLALEVVDLFVDKAVDLDD